MHSTTLDKFVENYAAAKPPESGVSRQFESLLNLLSPHGIDCIPLKGMDLLLRTSEPLGIRPMYMSISSSARRIFLASINS